MATVPSLETLAKLPSDGYFAADFSPDETPRYKRRKICWASFRGQSCFWWRSIATHDASDVDKRLVLAMIRKTGDDDSATMFGAVDTASAI